MKYFILKLIRLKYRHYVQHRHQAGFSILELLVTITIAWLAIQYLLILMVEGMSYNQQEQTINEISQDMELALDYISGDVREAIYIYNGEQLESRENGSIAGLKSFLPSFGSNTRPILAFWKVEPLAIPTNWNCQTTFASNSSKKDECETVKIERRAYSLVVYLQSTDNSNGKWKGKSRIVRYQLNKYSNISNLTRSTGYVDPVSESTFKKWPISAGGVNLQTAIPSNVTDTLVDFVASPTDKICDNNSNTPLPQCNDFEIEEYGRSPIDNNWTNTNSFFAYIRNSEDNTGAIFNQDVVLYLKGSAEGKQQIQETDKVDFTFLKSQVLSRSVLTKTVPE